MNWGKLLLELLQLLLGSKHQKSQVRYKRNRRSYQTQKRQSGSSPTVFENVQAFEKIPVKLHHHVDGDTSAFVFHGKEYRARFLMLDTPETVKKDTKVMPIGHEASNYTKDRLEHAHKLEIAFDKGSHADNYGRLLVYVYVDGSDLAQELIERGYAIVRYVNAPNDSNERKYKQLQAEARHAKRGVWYIPNYVILKHDDDYMYNEKFE